MQSSQRSITCAALLFDLDGVLVDSTACVEETWRAWAARHELDASEILKSSHGRRAVDTVKRALPNLDEKEIAAEVAALEQHESRETVGVLEVPGAAELLTSLPRARWAIVTSGVRAVAEHRLRHVGLPIPPVMVCADEVVHGKPHPEGYLTAADKLGIAPELCVVVEDAPAGLTAAHAARMRVRAVLTTHSSDALADADLIAASLCDVSVHTNGGGASDTMQLVVTSRRQD